MALRAIQNKLDAVRRSQALLAKEEAELVAQLRELRNVGDPPFVFLYETGNSPEELYCRWFKSRNLAAAAVNMAKFMERHAWKWHRPRVDYEVEFKGDYIDLYELGESHPIYEYLP